MGLLTMRSIGTHLATTLSILLLLIVSLDAAAFAQTNCDAIIVDDGNFFGSNIDRVDEAAQRLLGLGVEVRIRTMRSLGGAGNLDSYEALQRDQCASWRSPEGTRKNTLVVFMMYVESQTNRGTGLYYGGQWDSTLGRNTTHLRIQTEFMNPRFRDGDFAGGFVAGINETYRVINQHLNPPVSGGSGSFGSALVYIALIIAAMVLVWWAISFGLRRRRERAENEAAQNDAIAERQRVTEALLDLTSSSEGISTLDMLEARVNKLLPMVAPSTGDPISFRLKELKHVVEGIQSAVADLATTASDPTHEKLGTEVYESIHARYQVQYEKITSARGEVVEIRAAIDSAAEMAERAPELLEAARSGMASIEDALKGAEQQGFKISELETRKRALELKLEEASYAIEERALDRAARLTDEVSEATKSLVKYAQDLPNIKKSLSDEIGELAARIEKSKVVIEEGHNAFDVIESQFAPIAIESVEGNGSQSEQNLTLAVQGLETAKVLSQPDRQEWMEGWKAARISNQELDEVDMMIRAIHDLKAKLFEAREISLEEINEARADIEQAHEYIQKYDADIEERLEEELQRAREILELAIQGEQKSKPHSIWVVERARQANEAADAILIEAHEQHQRMERLRRRFGKALSTARWSISESEDYIASHRRDVRSTAKDTLARAKKYLSEAASQSDLEEGIRLAKKAHQYSSDAYSTARRNVRDARRRRASSWDDGGGSFSFGGGSSGGGGGISFGGSSSGSGGGGSSSSWGSSGGGGSSSRW